MVIKESMTIREIRALKKKVNKNTRILSNVELGRERIVMDTTPDTTAVMQNVSFVAQGDAVNSRHGNTIQAKSIFLSGSIEKNLASTGTMIRFVLFRDNLGTTTAPVLTDLWADEDDFFSNHPRLINPQPMQRFTILWDKHIVLNENFDGQRLIRNFQFSKKLNHKVLYTGSAATDEGKGSVWFLSGSDEATNVPIVSGDIVFKYRNL